MRPSSTWRSGTPPDGTLDRRPSRTLPRRVRRLAVGGGRNVPLRLPLPGGQPARDFGETGGENDGGRSGRRRVAGRPPESRARPLELVDNALKYGKEGGRVTLSGRFEQDACLLEVADDGPGISPEHLPRIFERFFRVDRGGRGSSEGRGWDSPSRSTSSSRKGDDPRGEPPGRRHPLHDPDPRVIFRAAISRGSRRTSCRGPFFTRT